jgi:hypothetical protein
MDVLSASMDKIGWYENADGQGNFGQQQVITAEAGGDAVYAADMDGDGDLDVLSVRWSDGKVVWYENRLVGDANDDGIFDSSDLVQVFQAGEYEDGIPNNSTYEEGDGDGDGEFDSSDLVFAFQAGIYEKPAALRCPDVAAAIDAIFAELNPRSRMRAYVA